MLLRHRLDARFQEHCLLETSVGEPAGACLGVIQRASDQETPDFAFTTPRLTLRVRRDSLATVGQVLVREGQHYILAYQSESPDYRTFWLIYCHKRVAWRQQLTEVEPLTGEPRKTGWSAVRYVWSAVELNNRENFDRDMRIREEQVRFITAAPIELNDEVERQQVRRITPVLGVNIVTAQ